MDSIGADPRETKNDAPVRRGMTVMQLRTALYIACGLLMSASLGFLALSGWFEQRKHTLSGVPTNHFAVNDNGRLFWVHRGGGPVNERPQVPMTAEQYRRWEENDRSGNFWGGSGVLCFFGTCGIAVWLKMAGSGRTGASVG